MRIRVSHAKCKSNRKQEQIQSTMIQHMHSTLAAGWAIPCLIQMGTLLEAEPTCRLITSHLQYVTVAWIQHTCNTLQLQLAALHFHMCLPTVRSSLPVFDRGGVLDVTCDCESLSCLSRHPGSPPSGRPRTRDPLACAGDSVTESVRVMVDLRAETSSLSDKTEITETQGPSAPHHCGRYC